MTELETITRWLKTFPLWGEQSLAVDYVDALPGCAGLYPQGLEEISRQRDILGNVTVHNRLQFVLYQVCAGENSGWLLAMQDWIQAQSMAGSVPQFGHRTVSITAQKGRLHSVKQTGICKYTALLTVEFIKTSKGDI